MTDFLHKLSTPVNPYIKRKLNAYTCGYDGDKVQICCSSTPINITESQVREEFISQPGIPDISSHKNLPLLEKDCGYLSEEPSKIAGGGTNAALKEFPLDGFAEL